MTPFEEGLQRANDWFLLAGRVENWSELESRYCTPRVALLHAALLTIDAMRRTEPLLLDHSLYKTNVSLIRALFYLRAKNQRRANENEPTVHAFTLEKKGVQKPAFRPRVITFATVHQCFRCAALS